MGTGLLPCLSGIGIKLGLASRSGQLVVDREESLAGFHVLWLARVDVTLVPPLVVRRANRGYALPLWFARRGQLIGYGFAQTRSDDVFRHPDTVTLGPPIRARTSGDAVACVRAAVQWVREHSAVARMSVTGPHPPLAALLAARFRIVEAGTFCSAADKPFVDPQRYISSGATCSDLSLALT